MLKLAVSLSRGIFKDSDPERRRDGEDLEITILVTRNVSRGGKRFLAAVERHRVFTPHIPQTAGNNRKVAITQLRAMAFSRT